VPNLISAGALPQTLLIQLTTLHRSPSQLGKQKPSPKIFSLSKHAFGVSAWGLLRKNLEVYALVGKINFYCGGKGSGGKDKREGRVRRT